MKFYPVFVEARDIDDAWHQLLYKCHEKGRKYEITSGSHAGSNRLSLDYVSGFINNPHTTPMAPRMPEGSNLPIPTTDENIHNYFANYVMDSTLAINEEYRYATWIVGGKIRNQLGNLGKDVVCYDQMEWIIKHFKEHGYGNEHCYITIGYPESNLAYDNPFMECKKCKHLNYKVDKVCTTCGNESLIINEKYRGTSPCLRGLDFKITEGYLVTHVIYRSWDLYCISEDSEILTNNGWKGINNITKDDKSASLNIDDWVIEYCDIDDIIKYKHIGKMKHIKNGRVDQLVTDNHRILHKYVTHSGNNRIIKDYTYTYAKDLIPKDGSYIPVAAPYRGGDTSVGKDLSSLLGWVLTDAHYKTKCDAIEIYQSENKYHNEIRDLLNRLNIEFTETLREKKSFKICEKVYPEGITTKHYVFYIKSSSTTKWIKQILPDREPTSYLLDLVYDERITLFNTMIMADGSVKSETNCAFYSIKPKRLDWFQLLAFSIGYSSIIDNDNGSIYLSKRKESLIQRSHFDKNKLPEIDYNGYVWCIKNKNKNFVMRRNNLISITGNCGFPENIGGFALLNQYIASELEVNPGPIAFSSKGMHVYEHHLEILNSRLGK